MSSSDVSSNLERIQQRIRVAAGRVGRRPEDIRLVAVSKGVSPERIRQAWELGIADFGENRAQEAIAKQDALRDLGIRWHFIGHLQTNKVRMVLGRVSLIHSVDSLKVAEAIGRGAEDEGRAQPILIQVNVAAEATKHGFSSDEALARCEAIAALPGLAIEGFMTVAPRAERPEDIRWVFRRLRELKEACEKRLARPLPVLSMGMTHDLEIAIEEGATLVRVGTGLFGQRARDQEEAT